MREAVVKFYEGDSAPLLKKQGSVKHGTQDQDNAVP